MQLPEPTKFSLGSRGSFSIDLTPFFFALAALIRWRETDSARILCEVFRRKGVADLARGIRYRQVEQRIAAAVKAEAGHPDQNMNNVRLVNSVVHRLLKVDNELKQFAQDSSAVLRSVANQLPEIQRMTGHVVRSEGPATLVVIETGERDELRQVDSRFLKRFDISREGEPFVLYRQKWTPDTTMEQYLPAIEEADMSTAEDDMLETRMRQAEVPLAQSGPAIAAKPEPAHGPAIPG